MVRELRVEPLLDCAGRQPKRLPPPGDFHRLQIRALKRSRAYKRLNLLSDLGLEASSQAPLLAVACASASRSWS